MHASGKTTAEEPAGLRKIRRERGWTWFWGLSYIPVVWVVKHTTHSNVADIPIVLIWAIGFVRSVARVIFSNLPTLRRPVLFASRDADDVEFLREQVHAMRPAAETRTCDLSKP